ncbi:MAG: hypothetical protein EKK49_16280 [Rhodocyclaceae bacterium]|nr:MAG: hypothetical protein EKK49_16280 [Rhodocyclaceae bacterium]
MTELKSYSLPELEELAEQIKATILKREQEEQEAARRQAEEAERAARAAEEEAARLAAEAAAKAAAEAEEKARAATAARERKQAAEKARREAAEAKAKAQAEAEKAKEAAQAEISFAEAAPPAPTEMPLVRFMHPSNRALTWSGDGPKPDWVNAWLATGGTLYALEIAAEKLAPKPIPASLRPR